MADPGRVIRAFFKALALTVRGQAATIAAGDNVRQQFPALIAWCESSVAQVEAVYAALRGAGWDAAQISGLTLHLEGRDLALATALETIRFHAAREIPHLLTAEGAYAQLTVQALALNDRYLAQQFSTAALPPAAQTALATLAAHLAAPPSAPSG